MQTGRQRPRCEGMVIGFIRDLFGGAERDAAQLQAQASDRATNSLRNTERTANRNLLPYQGAGAAVINPLTNFVLDGPETELTRTQGFDDISKSAAAGGKLRSGDTLKELTKFSRQIDEGNRRSRFSELFNLATLGRDAAGQSANISANLGTSIADTILGKGDALAAGRIGAANRFGSTLQGIGSFLGLL